MICGLHHNPITLQTGGGIRTFNVLRMLGEISNTHVTLYSLSGRSSERNIDGIAEKQIRKPILLSKVRSGYLCLFPTLIAKTLQMEFEKIVPSAIVFESIFMGFATLKSTKFSSKTIKIYDAHNVESFYWKPYFDSVPFGKHLLHEIKKIEEFVATNSDYVFTTSDEESEIFQREYGISREKILVVPNGVDTTVLKPSNDNEKDLRQKRLVWNYPKYVVFIGSAVKANIDACNWIINYLSVHMPETCFLIIGTVCREFTNWPDNVKPLGVLPFQDKNVFLSISDAAINPVTIGAGTNVKMLEYMSLGLPIVTTRIGARGLGITDNCEAIICEREEFARNLHEIFRNNSLKENLKRNSRILAEQFDWLVVKNTIQKKLAHRLS